jgi:hypothetical protein
MLYREQKKYSANALNWGSGTSPKNTEGFRLLLNLNSYFLSAMQFSIPRPFQPSSLSPKPSV